MEHRVRRQNRILGGVVRAGFAGAVVAVAVATGTALGAVERVPDGLTTATELSADQKQQVRKFVTAQVDRIKTGDAQAIEEARKSLMSPFIGAEPTIGFRLEYGRAGASDLKRLARDKDVQRAINAVLVCGSIGTSEAIDAIADALKDPRPAIRGAGAGALREVIVTSAGSRVRSAQGTQAVKLVGTALATEKNSIAALALVAALEPVKQTEFHADGAAAVGGAMAALVVVMPAPTSEAGVRGAEAIQRGLGILFARMIDPGQASSLNLDYYKLVVGAGAHALGYASRHAEDVVGNPTGDGAAELALVVSAAEQCVLFGEARIKNSAPEKSSLKDAFDKSVSSGDASGFRKAAAALIERGAGLVGAHASDFGG